jgi:superfamily II DNA or RNA helicase
MITLRPYQQTGIDDIRSQLRAGHKRIVYQLATGGGKTVIFAHIIRNLVRNNLRCMIVSNRCELLTQTGGTFASIGIQTENITAASRNIPRGLVSIAMIETLKRRLKSRLEFQMYVRGLDVVIIDEAHICAFDSLFAYLSPACIVLGFTATPIRFGKMPELGQYFTSLVHGPDIASLISDNYLSHPRYYGVPVALGSVRISHGEFDEADLQKIYTSSEVFGGLRDNLSRHGAGRKTIIFCPTVETSKQVAAEIGCLHIDGTESPENRRRILGEFHSRPDAIISNVGILTTGYDHPPVSRIVLYRATKSLPLFLQCCGRGSRVCQGKDDFMVLDFGNNILRHGFWHTERTWKLENDRTRKVNADREDIFPIKDCPQCGALVATNTRICPECGYAWTVSETERRIVELQEMEYGAIMQKVKAGASVQELEQIRSARGYKIGWLLRQLQTKDQFREYATLRGYKPYWVQIQAERYLTNGTESLTNGGTM